VPSTALVSIQLTISEQEYGLIISTK